MRTALIAVDVQKDFIDGSLGGRTPGAVAARRAVIVPIVAIARRADLVVASGDRHPSNHVSFAAEPKFTDGSWPIHAVEGTEGAEIDPAIAEVADYLVYKGMDPAVEAYSAFDGFTVNMLTGKMTDVALVSLLALKGFVPGDGNRIVVAGIATDYCVLATALSAVQRGFATYLAHDATAGVANETTGEALVEMSEAGVGMLAGADPLLPRPPYVRSPQGEGNVRDAATAQERLTAEREAEFAARDPKPTAVQVAEARKLLGAATRRQMYVRPLSFSYAAE